MIRLRGQMVCMTAEERSAVLAHMGEHIRLTQAEPGCLSFDISETDDPFTFEVMEAFRDREAFDLHQARTNARRGDARPSIAPRSRQAQGSWSRQC